MLPENSKKVLDIGSGTGEFTQMIIDRLKDAEITGMDINLKYAALAEKYHYREVIADAGKPLPVADSSFDLVVASEIIEHLDDTDTFVQEIYRVLKPGGIWVCVTPNLASNPNIIALMLGRQHYTCQVNDMGDFGVLFPTSHPEWDGQKTKWRTHRRIFTAPSLK